MAKEWDDVSVIFAWSLKVKLFLLQSIRIASSVCADCGWKIDSVDSGFRTDQAFARELTYTAYNEDIP